MRHLKSILIALLLGGVLIFGIAYFLKSNYRIEKSIYVKSSPAEIFPYISDLNKWPRWTAWNDKKYEELKIYYSGVPLGKGSTMKWESTGDNGKVIVNQLVTNQSVSFDVIFQDDFVSQGIISLKSSQDGVIVKWEMSGDVGNNYLQRYLLLFTDKLMETDLSTGLENLKKICEKD